MRIVTICGSLAESSANRAALDVAVESLSWVDGLEIEGAPPIDTMPTFRPELVAEPPAPVAGFRQVVESADGLVIAAPEYGGGVAGATKNALDWMVGSGSLYHRPVAVMSAGTSGGEFAIEQLVRTLSWQGALVVATLGIASPRTKSDVDGRFTDPVTLTAIAELARSLADAIGATPGERLERVARTVVPFGIDPARFGSLD